MIWMVCSVVWFISSMIDNMQCYARTIPMETSLISVWITKSHQCHWRWYCQYPLLAAMHPGSSSPTSNTSVMSIWTYSILVTWDNVLGKATSLHCHTTFRRWVERRSMQCTCTAMLGQVVSVRAMQRTWLLAVPVEAAGRVRQPGVDGAVRAPAVATLPGLQGRDSGVSLI